MPLYERLKANPLTSAKLAVDETPIPGAGKTKTDYFWTIARDNSAITAAVANGELTFSEAAQSQVWWRFTYL